MKPSSQPAILTFIAVLVLVALAPAQTFTTLYNFTGGTDGGDPFDGLIRDSAGNLYGTASRGGSDGGVVFEVTSSGTEIVLHTFTEGATDGGFSRAPLLRDPEGNLYGTTVYGGTSNSGVVFKIDTAGNETVLYNFAGGYSDGCNPWQGLVMDGKGNLYGTTEACGPGGYGTVYKLTTKGEEKTLHNFGGSDGVVATEGHLLMDKAGDLYGVTAFGGAGGCKPGGYGGCGVLYKLTRTGTFTLLHSFAGGSSDGCYPVGSVRMDQAGNLYGTTGACGSSNNGTVWTMNPEGKETILYNFAGGTSDGCAPEAGVTLDSKGRLYGSTTLCGANNFGTLWKLNKKGVITLLHSFNGRDGYEPLGELVHTATGELFGTTYGGGADGNNAGTVWKYVP